MSDTLDKEFIHFFLQRLLWFTILMFGPHYVISMGHNNWSNIVAIMSKTFVFVLHPCLWTNYYWLFALKIFKMCLFRVENDEKCYWRQQHKKKTKEQKYYTVNCGEKSFEILSGIWIMDMCLLFRSKGTF